MQSPFWVYIIRAAVVYIAVIILLRLGGKRQIGQMGTGEFVAILLISNAVQNSMNGGDNSITAGLILAAVIILLSVIVAFLTYKSPKLEGIIQGQPTTLIEDGHIITKNLEKELLNPHELREILRRQGIHDISDIKSAILESDGNISITKQFDSGINGNNNS